MKKRFFIWMVVLVAFAGLSTFLLLWRSATKRDKPISNKDISEFVAKIRGGREMPVPAALAPIDLKRPVRLAIGGLGRRDDVQNGQLEDLVLTDLTGAPGLELVERQSLDKVLPELNLTISHLVRAQDAVRVGKLLKADWFLLGTQVNINGTNTLVVRLVDSRTGIMRDAGVFTGDGSPVKLAAGIAGFVRQSRQDASTTKPRVYLAIGTFRDLSLNNRQAEFPTQLRAYLMAAYQTGNVMLLEREAVNVLYQEVRLDLAGLTENGGITPPQPLQDAYWFVDGDYQSYETTNLEVEVTLKINRMFGRFSRETLHGAPDRFFFEKIKQAMDTKMNQDASPILLSFANEVDAQMAVGKKLAGLEGTQSSSILPIEVIGGGGAQDLDQQESARQRRNDEEAIQAFETILLLQPTNREAKIYLAACFRKPTIARLEEARKLYREILEASVQDHWTDVAQRALVASFEWLDPSEKARWFAAALMQNTNAALDEFYRRNAGTAMRDAAIQNGDSDAVNQAEKRLLEAIRSNKDALEGKLGVIDMSFGVDEFPGAFKDKTEAAKALATLLPKLEKEFPELAPHLTAAVLSFQVDTNSSVVGEYQKQLEWFLAHTNQLYHPERFWDLARNTTCNWLFDHKLYALAIETMDGYRNTAGQNFGDEDKIALGFADMKVERWKEALEIFDSFGRMPILMTSYGLWGSSLQPVLTSQEADYCREKLGSPVVQDPREFLMGRTGVALCYCSTFTVDE